MNFVLTSRYIKKRLEKNAFLNLKDNFKKISNLKGNQK
jgi:hypothetical protein